MKDSVVVVTGAAGNLGRAVMTKLAAHGAKIVAVDREMAALEAAVSAIDRGGHLPLPGVDLMNAAACDEMMTRALDGFGRIDGLVHTVGGFAMGGVDGDPALFESMFRLNVLTTANTFGAAARAMRAQGFGAIVTLGAGVGVKAPSGLAAYAASKSAVHRIVESYAEELKAHGVRVNAILPSILDTPQNRAAMTDADFSSWVSLDNAAETIRFLLSDAGRDITGALLPVSGRV